MTSTFSFTLIDEKTIEKSIQSLKPKTSSGTDHVSSILLKFCSDIISKPISAIINQSLKNGIFPDKLKIAKIIPIFKKDDEGDSNNYRPISLLPAISKLFERIVHNQLFHYLTINRLLYDHQYGFREKYSTESATLEFIDTILQDLDNSKIPITIFLDLSKAFDTIDHNILLQKLGHYGISNNELKWFNSYITDRTQFVEIDNAISSSKHITTGVPQGSILGPLLFLIYINDLSFSSKIFKPIMYADDTNLVSTVCTFNTNRESMAENINRELNYVTDWLAVNKLSLNASKTKMMLFHHHNRKLKPSEIPHVEINGQKIELVNEFKFLGLKIDSHLTWTPHINFVANKLSRINGILHKLKHFLPPDILLIIYTALFQSHLNYGITCWGHAAPNTSRIARISKKAIRAITLSKYNSHTTPLFKAMNILKLEDTYKLSCLKFYHKNIHNEVPIYFSSMFNTGPNTRVPAPVPAPSRPRRTIRPPARYADTIHDLPYTQNHIKIITTNKIFTRSCIRHIIPKLINEEYLPDIVTSKLFTHSLQGFSTYAKTHLLNSYDPECHIPHCYICNRI